MNWVVVARAAFEAWEVTTDPQEDADLRIEVLTWLLGLQDSGPPIEGIFAPFRETNFTMVAETGVWVEYLVLPNLDAPAIAIRELRGGTEPR